MTTIPQVLYSDESSVWLPLKSLYWSNESKILLCRTSSNIIEEIMSHYCPQCCNRYTDEEALSYSNKCPYCYECPRCNSVVLVENKTEKSYVFLCKYCFWNSKEIIIETLSNEEIYKAVNNEKNLLNSEIKKLFDSLINDYNNKYITNQSSKEFSSMNDILENKNEIINNFSLKKKINENIDLPLYIKLKVKKMLRCKQDYNNNLMSILIQPNLDPLEGDSSRRNKRGKWWSKDSSAINEIPNIILLNILKYNNQNIIQLKIINMKDIYIKFQLLFNVSYNNEYMTIDNNIIPKMNKFHHNIISLITINSLEFLLQPHIDDLLKDDDNDINNISFNSNEFNDIIKIIDNCGYMNIPIELIKDFNRNDILTGCLDITMIILEIDNIEVLKDSYKPIPIKIILPIDMIC